MELHNLLPADRKADTEIVAVSPDPLDKLELMVPKVKGRTKSDFAITLLADSDHQVIDRYGLLNEEAAKQKRWLPHPTTYVIDKQGIVRWKFTEVNYRIRPSNQVILAELNKLR